MFGRFISLVKRKLGVCRLCIALSLAFSTVFTAAYLVVGGSSPLSILLLVVAGFFTGLLIAHGLAWLYRRFLSDSSGEGGGG